MINNALQILGEVCGSARAYVFLFDHETDTMTNTHEWCAPGVEPQMEMLTDLPCSIFPWWMGKLTRREMILVPDVSKMDPEAHSEQDILERQSVKSVLVLPIFADGTLAGFIGLDDVTSPTPWKDETREYLQVAADMVSSTITRAHRSRIAQEQTEQLKQANESIRHTQQQLLEAERLAGLGILAAGVAHEINNPIGFIKSNTQTARDYLDRIRSILAMLTTDATREEIITAFREQDLEYILTDMHDILIGNIRGIERITTVIRNLMTFSRAEDPNYRKQGDLRESIASAIDSISGTVRNVVEIELDLAPIPDTLCNAHALTQAFVQILLRIARTFPDDSPVKGTVTIRTWVEENSIHCTIEDNGPGIPGELIPRIFEPSLAPEDGEIRPDLGMSIAYHTVVNKHGGTIKLEKRHHGGSRFHLTIPILESPGL